MCTDLTTMIEAGAPALDVQLIGEQPAGLHGSTGDAVPAWIATSRRLLWGGGQDSVGETSSSSAKQGQPGPACWAHLHAAYDHAVDHFACVLHDGVLGSVHVQGGHSGGVSHHAQLGQALHACSKGDPDWQGQLWQPGEQAVAACKPMQDSQADILEPVSAGCALGNIGHERCPLSGARAACSRAGRHR